MAHNQKPVVLVGKNGISDTLIESINVALEARELIKIKFVDLKDQKKELIDEIEAKTKSNVVGMIGNIATVYRQQEDEEKRKIEI